MGQPLNPTHGQVWSVCRTRMYCQNASTRQRTKQQEAQLSPMNRAMRRSCQSKSCQLTRNSAETTVRQVLNKLKS